jgi:phosphoglycerate dehydrogenase-like enzyme
LCAPGKQPGESELLALLPGCIGYLAGIEPITARVLDGAGNLRVISRNGTGVDNIDLAAAETRGIAVLRAEGANARGVAELAIGQMFALARSTGASDSSLKRGAWERQGQGIELEGKTLGLVGCGRVGRHVARMALGIGMTVLAFDPFPDGGFTPGQGFRFASIDEVLSEADFLSLHCPPANDGKPFLDGFAISRLKCGVFIINTARYDVFDAGAILAGLDSRQIAGIALDAFDTEPPTDRRLAEHPRVLATPHIGGFTRESIDRAMTMAVENLIAALRSK